MTWKRAFSPVRNRAALRRLARRFTRNRKGIAAVEFAMVLPAMLAIYFGIVEVAQGIMIDRKVTQLNRALADLTAQAATINTAERDNIFNAATTVMAPFTSVAPQMRITSVVIDANRVAKVCWSEALNTAPLARNAEVTLPDDLRIANTSLIVARSSYAFTPTVGHLITGGAIDIGNSDIYMRPRLGKIGGTGSVEQVERAGVAMCPPF